MKRICLFIRVYGDGVIKDGGLGKRKEKGRVGGGPVARHRRRRHRTRAWRAVFWECYIRVSGGDLEECCGSVVRVVWWN